MRSSWKSYKNPTPQQLAKVLGVTCQESKEILKELALEKKKAPKYTATKAKATKPVATDADAEEPAEEETQPLAATSHTEPHTALPSALPGTLEEEIADDESDHGRTLYHGRSEHGDPISEHEMFGDDMEDCEEEPQAVDPEVEVTGVTVRLPDRQDSAEDFHTPANRCKRQLSFAEGGSQEPVAKA